MGVEMESLAPGSGKTFPQAGNRLEVHYTGTLASNGAKFDSSRDKGKPFTFVIGAEPRQVIRGWDEGLLQMSIGERATLRITSDFAYGEQGYGDGSKIPPNADLVFDVELLAINGKSRADLDKFEVELSAWVAKKLEAFESEEKTREKYPTKEEYEKHLRKKAAKQLRHIG
mmetsp:Transcript_124357/g.264978  ORF Transcript_124357/g.264978 Transcript_124357/m.264978 type:complete len:171 (-) Transcript_124357:127-639(-)